MEFYMCLCPTRQRHINITRKAIGPNSGQKDCRTFELARSCFVLCFTFNSYYSLFLSYNRS